MGRLKCASTRAAKQNPKPVVQVLVIFAICRETGCWQQECEAGIRDDSQLCAIFSQQFRSSAVSCRSGKTHAMTGIATTAMTRTTATHCETLPNIAIVSRLRLPTSITSILKTQCTQKLPTRPQKVRQRAL